MAANTVGHTQTDHLRTMGLVEAALEFAVEVLKPGGTFVAKWGSNGGGPGQFSRPNGVAVGPTGNVFVTDVFNGRVQKFTPNGAYINEFGVPGGGPGMFNLTFGIWAEPDGDLVTVGGDTAAAGSIEGP